MAKRVAILGGGVAGLACAHYLARSGERPIVLEPSETLGPLGSPLVHDGLRIDRRWTPLCDSDTALCGLLADLGALGRVAWRRTRSAIWIAGAFHPLSSAGDLLRSTRHAGLSRPDRLRARIGLTYLTRARCHAHDLRDLSAAEWLPRVFGQRVYERCCRPFLEARFGEYAEQVPADWVFRRLKAYQKGREVVGYLRGGSGWLGERLRRSIEARGGEVRVHAAITAVEASRSGCSLEVDGRELGVDAVVSTLPPPRLAKLARGRLASQLPDLEVPYQGLVTALLILERSVGDFYQTTFIDRAHSLRRTIEATHIVPSELVGGRHFLYVRDPCAPHTARFKQSDAAVRLRVIAALQQSFPNFSPGDVEAVYVSRDEAAEPVPLPRSQRPALPSCLGRRVFLCTSATAPPQRASWDGEVMVARETATAVAA